MKNITIPVVIGAPGLFKKGIETNENLCDNKIQEIQKNALLETAHIIKKILSSK